MSALSESPSVSLSFALHWGWSKSIWRRATSLITTPCQQPDLVASSTMVNELSFGFSSLTLFKGFGPRMGLPESSSRVWGVLVHPFPSVQAYLWTTSFVGRISWSTHGVVNATWRLNGVRIWKLSRAYPGEKPASLSVLTHRCSLATRKPTWHLLAMPCILVRIGAPYEGGWPTQFLLPRNYGTIFNPKFLFFLIKTEYIILIFRFYN